MTHPGRPTQQFDHDVDDKSIDVDTLTREAVEGMSAYDFMANTNKRNRDREYGERFSEKMKSLFPDVLELADEYIVACDAGADTTKFVERMHAFSPVLRVFFWTMMTRFGIDKLEVAKRMHRECAELVVDCLVPPSLLTRDKDDVK